MPCSSPWALSPWRCSVKNHHVLKTRLLLHGALANKERLAKGESVCKGIFLEKIMAHEQYQSCIEACNECAVACDHCATSCLQEQDVKAMARCIAMDMDCAQICRLAASYMARGSEFASALCQMCAEVCEACGEECAKHQMSHCQECAQACRRCAAECRRMAGMGTAAQGAGSGMSAH